MRDRKNAGQSKMEGQKLRDWKMRQQTARMENAGVQNAGPIYEGEKCGTLK